jgi:hypothetical protein
MKLSNEALVSIIEALRLGLTEGVDVSELLKRLDLEPNSENRLTPIKPVNEVFTLKTE